MAAISTAASHVSRALDFYNKTDVYFCIGKTTVWTDELNPPEPDPTTLDVSQIIGFKKVETKQLVIPDPSGSIIYRNTSWTTIVPTNAVASNAKWVYISSTIQYDDLPVGYYRQIGVYSGLILAVGVSAGLVNLLPSQVQSNGILEVLDNRVAEYHAIDSRDSLSLILQF